MSKSVSVFDPDSKMIIKQYSSKTSAARAALILSDAGYLCEYALLSNAYVKNLMCAMPKDPSKLLFGYRWINTSDLKRGNFEIQERDSNESSIWKSNQATCVTKDAISFFQRDDLASPTPTNIVILKEDTASGCELRGFASEESAYQDWRNACEASMSPVVGGDGMDEFQKNFLDGHQSVNGLIWKRVVSSSGKFHSESATASGKVVIEQEYAQSNKKIKRDEISESNSAPVVEENRW